MEIAEISSTIQSDFYDGPRNGFLSGFLIFIKYLKYFIHSMKWLTFILFVSLHRATKSPDSGQKR